MNSLQKTYITLGLLLVATTVALAQSTQPVLVLEYRGTEAKQPLEGVSLSANNAATVASDAEGRLELRFRTLHAGDRVQVRRVDKAGYEVFNRDALEQWNVAPATPFRLIMCESSRFKALCDQYLQRASDNYERQYKREQERLAALRRDKKLQEEEYQQQLQQLEDAYNEQLDNLDNYVDRFARIDLETLSAEQQKIVALVQEGRFEEAIAAYEAADYIGQYARESQERQQIQSAQQQLAQLDEQKRQNQTQLIEAIRSQVMTYQMAGGIENHRKARQLLKDLADADTTNVRTLQMYMDCLCRQLECDQAEVYGQRYERLIKGQAHLQFRFYHQMARMYGILYKNEEAMAYHQRARHLINELTRNGEVPEDIRIDYLGLITNAAQFYFRIDGDSGFVLAGQMIDELWPHVLKWYDESPDLYRCGMMWVKAQRGFLMYHNQHLVDEGIAEIEAAMEMMRPYLDIEQFSSCFQGAATYLSLIGEGEERPELVEKALLEDLEVTRKWYDKNPESGVQDYVITLINLSTHYLDTKDYAKAEETVALAETIHEEFVRRYHQPFPPAVLIISYVRTIVCHHKGDLDGAKAFRQKTIDAFKQMPEGDQQWYADFLKTLNALFI